MKLLKRLLIFIFILVVIIVVAVIVLVKSIAVEVTDADLPQVVYQQDADLLITAQANLLGMILASETERYTIIEEFVNYIILDSIQTNINPNYDPLGDLDTDATNYVINEGYVYIDYVYAKLNDNNQMVICISFGSDQYMEMHSAIYLTFDIDIEIKIDLLEINAVLTLVDYAIADHNLPFKVLDYLFTKLDKASIEESMTFGTLDLDEYSFTITLIG